MRAALPLLARVRANDPALTMLPLSGRVRRWRTARSLGRALRHAPNTACVAMDLSCNDLCVVSSRDQRRWKSVCVASSRSLLRTIDLGYNRLAPEDIMVLSRSMPRFSALCSLDLRANAIRAAGCEALAVALPRCPFIESLNLSENEIGDGGAAAMALAIAVTPQLRKLVLDMNWVGSEGARALGAGLAKRPPASLDLSLANNDLADSIRKRKVQPAGLELLFGEQSIRALSALRIGSSHVHDAGALVLARTLQTSASVSVVDVSDCDLTEPVIRELIAAIEDNPSVAELHLYRNSCPHIMLSEKVMKRAKIYEA